MTKHTPGPWYYVPSTEHHGPYVYPTEGYGDICDCYTMSHPYEPSVRNGGRSKPIHMQGEAADANARLIAAAPDLLEALKLAEDVLARFPFSAEIWPNGTHPNTGMEQIRAAIAKAIGETK